MFQRLCFTIGLIFMCQFASAADIRWCTITGKNEADKLIYMPIARAAHVEEVAILRVNFTTVGNVLKIEPISGPEMLVKSSTEQVKTWHLSTSAIGDAPCQSLVVIKYRILPEDYTVPLMEDIPGESRPAGIYVISIDVRSITIAVSTPALAGEHHPI